MCGIAGYLAKREGVDVAADLTAMLEALHGRVTAHHRFMLKLHLAQIAALETAIAEVEAHIGERLAPFRAAVSLLTTMPGLRETAVAVILAEHLV